MFLDSLWLCGILGKWHLLYYVQAFHSFSEWSAEKEPPSTQHTQWETTSEEGKDILFPICSIKAVGEIMKIYLYAILYIFLLVYRSKLHARLHKALPHLIIEAAI